MKQEIDRQSSKQRIQERLRARREARQQSAAAAAGGGGATTATTATTATAPPSSPNFFTTLDQRAQSARDRTAARVASRQAGEQKDPTNSAPNALSVEAILKKRSEEVTKKLIDVEERIKLNNVAISGLSATNKE